METRGGSQDHPQRGGKREEGARSSPWKTRAVGSLACSAAGETSSGRPGPREQGTRANIGTGAEVARLQDGSVLPAARVLGTERAAPPKEVTGRVGLPEARGPPPPSPRPK